MSVSVPPRPLYDWFGIVEGDDLEQGDIFESFRVFFLPESAAIPDSELQLRWAERDLIVLSQSCDLLKGREQKIGKVALCELWRVSEFKGEIGTPKGLESVRKGQRPRYHMIAKSEHSGFEREPRIVDLHQIHTFPVDYLRAIASKGRRLRLLPPYREHLSQSFARTYMRVGLPIDIPPFK